MLPKYNRELEICKSESLCSKKVDFTGSVRHSLFAGSLPQKELETEFAFLFGC
jgi:hypothetical protein